MVTDLLGDAAIFALEPGPPGTGLGLGVDRC